MANNPAIPVAHETILSTWGADVVARGVPIFANTAARDQALPFPDAGQVAALTDTNTVTMYHGSGWHTLNRDYFDLRFAPLSHDNASHAVDYLAVAGPATSDVVAGSYTSTLYLTGYGLIVTAVIEVNHNSDVPSASTLMTIPSGWRPATILTGNFVRFTNSPATSPGNFIVTGAGTVVTGNQLNAASMPVSGHVTYVLGTSGP